MSSNSWLRTHDHMSSKRATRIVGADRMPTDLKLDPRPIEFQGESSRERNKMFLSKMLLRTLMFCVGCGLPISVYAQPFTFKNTVFGQVSGKLYQDATKLEFVGLDSGLKVQPDDGGLGIEGVSISPMAADDLGGVGGQGYAFASAGHGKLSVRVKGIAYAALFQQRATVSVVAHASFYDTISILSAPAETGIPAGTLMVLNASMNLSGSLDASAEGTLSASYNTPTPDYQNASASVRLNIDGTGTPAPYPNNVFARVEHGWVSNFPATVRDVRYINEPAPASIQIMRTFFWGTPTPIEMYLNLSGTANAFNNFAGEYQPAAAEFDGDFSRTLKWGGISSITRYDTGETITGWTVSSASGFDYSRPAVPEPSTVLLAATAALLLVRRRHKRS